MREERVTNECHGSDVASELWDKRCEYKGRLAIAVQFFTSFFLDKYDVWLYVVFKSCEIFELVRITKKKLIINFLVEKL